MARKLKALAKATWFTYFPDDYRWSAAIGILYSLANTGGAVMGEIDQVGRRLSKKVGNDNHWFREWTKMGDHLRDLGMAAERKKNNLSAADFHKRACIYYQLGERFRTPKDKKANAVYRKSLDCFARFMRLTDRARIEKVELPFEKGKKLPAYLVHAQNTKKPSPL